jgi:hypothetical protein
MSLVSDIINDSLFYIGAYGPGETVATEDQTFGLRCVNRLLDSWSAQKLSPIGVKNVQYALSGAASYTYGPAKTWAATTRPIKVKAASTITASGIETPAQIVTAEEWVQIRDKVRTGLFVRQLLYDGGYPTGIVYVTPIPAAGNCSLWTYEAITDFANLTDTVALPPGYETALIKAFAMELCIPFGRPIPEGLPQLAQAAMMTIQTLNSEILGVPMQGAQQAQQQQPGGGRQ